MDIRAIWGKSLRDVQQVGTQPSSTCEKWASILQHRFVQDLQLVADEPTNGRIYDHVTSYQGSTFSLSERLCAALVMMAQSFELGVHELRDLGRLFFLHEFFHLKQGVQSDFLVYSDNTPNAFAKLDYAADAFAVDVHIRCFPRQSWQADMLRLLRLLVLGGHAFAQIEDVQGGIASISGERLERTLVWLWQSARASRFDGNSPISSFSLHSALRVELLTGTANNLTASESVARTELKEATTIQIVGDQRTTHLLSLEERRYLVDAVLDCNAMSGLALFRVLLSRPDVQAELGASQASALSKRTSDLTSSYEVVIAHLRAQRDESDDPNKINAMILDLRRVSRGQGLSPPTVPGFVLTRKLGEGGFGAVWLARGTADNQQRAIKIPHPHLAEDGSVMTRIARGASRIAKLRHPSIVQALEVRHLADNRPCLVMRWFPEGSLEVALKGVAPTRSQLFRVLKDVAGALDCAHAAQVVHRDVKPSNILIEQGRGFLTDWDSLKVPDSTMFTRGGVGTAGFSAPETLLGASHATNRSDIYGLAASALWALSGGTPSTTLKTRREAMQRASLSWEQEVLMFRAFDDDQNRRPESAEAFIDDLIANERTQSEVVVVGLDADRAMAAGFRRLDIPSSRRPLWVHEQSNMQFVQIDGGTSRLGSYLSEEDRKDDEGPVHAVDLKPFLIARTAVDQRTWERFMGQNPSYHKGMDRPVEKVTWDHALAFCQRLGLRLPSEAEWEHACRGGSATPFWSGGELHPSVNYERKHSAAAETGELTIGGTVPVDGATDHPWGLVHIVGNVWEWCADPYFPDSYAFRTRSDYEERRESLSRVMRGGSWLHGERFCRSAYRFGSHPAVQRPDLGLRPAWG